MGTILVSKKGKAPLSLIFAGFLFVIIGIWLFLTDKEAFTRDDTAKFVLKIAPVITSCTAIFFFLTAKSYSKTYITIYDDKIEGVGTCGKGGLFGHSFHFDSRTKYTVTLERSFICVNANDVRYYISLSADDAKDVMRAVKLGRPIPGADTPVNMKNGSSKRVVTCKCTFCGAKCKVPGGKGRITVTCHECKEQVTAIS